MAKVCPKGAKKVGRSCMKNGKFVKKVNRKR